MENQPTYAAAWGSDDDSNSPLPTWSEQLSYLGEGVPSYAKDTQSSIRKKPRFRRMGEGLTDFDDEDEESPGHPGGPGMKGRSCHLMSMRLRTLPISMPTPSPSLNSLISPRTGSAGLDWSDSLLRTSSMAQLFSQGGDKVPAQLSVSACNRIQYLYLRGNLLRGLWDTRCTPNLIVLDVSENEIESLDGVEYLDRLQHLYANSNALSSIEEVPMLPNLSILSLSCNRIRSFDRMQQQPSLEMLSLSDNKISSMAGLGACPHLAAIRLGGNPLAHLPGYRLAVLLSAAACGMLELAKLDGMPFVENELAQVACLPWPQRLSSLYGWVPGNLVLSYQESFAFLLSLQQETDRQRGCWLEHIGGDGTAEVNSTLCFEFQWNTFDAAGLEERAAAASLHLRVLEADVVKMLASMLCKGGGYLDHEEALSRALEVLHKAEWKLAALPPPIRKVIGRVGGRGAWLLGMRHQLHHLVVSARNSLVPLRLVTKVQWYRVDDWGNTEMIDGATHESYTVAHLDIGFTLKAESTCHVLNWQPLNLDDLQRLKEMGGYMQDITQGHTDLSITTGTTSQDQLDAIVGIQSLCVRVLVCFGYMKRMVYIHTYIYIYVYIYI